jgi:DNA topoisomerase IB
MRVSARVCALPGKAYVRKNGVFEPTVLAKRHCGKMVGMVDIKAGSKGRRDTHAILMVRGQQLAVSLKKLTNERGRK